MTVPLAGPGIVLVIVMNWSLPLLGRVSRTTIVRVSSTASASAYFQLMVIVGDVGTPRPTPDSRLSLTGVAGTKVLTGISGVGGLQPADPSRDSGAHARTVTM